MGNPKRSTRKYTFVVRATDRRLETVDQAMVAVYGALKAMRTPTEIINQYKGDYITLNTEEVES